MNRFIEGPGFQFPRRELWMLKEVGFLRSEGLIV